MRMRFCATMRRPASSITALTLPVRLRRVASGLMIEKVRSAMGRSTDLYALGRRRLIAARAPRAKASGHNSQKLHDGSRKACPLGAFRPDTGAMLQITELTLEA